MPSNRREVIQGPMEPFALLPTVENDVSMRYMLTEAAVKLHLMTFSAKPGHSCHDDKIHYIRASLIVASFQAVF
jgi:hypothetical protein